MDTLNDLNERVDAFVGTSSFDTPAAANDQAPIDVPAEVHEDIVASVDFSEVELADEFTEPQVAVTPNGLLPMEPLPIDGRLRKAALRMPDEIEEASGFTLFGRRIKSLIYTTDVAVIRNSNADAVFAVYPFTPQPAITQALLTVAECPVFVGVGGGTTTGKRSVQMAAVSEMQGAAGCVVNSPATAEMVEHITNIADIPVIATVVRCDDDAHAKVRAGAKILNIAAGKNTPQVLRELREHYPNLPLIAPGGKTPESIRETIAAGANAIIWTPPSAQQLQTDMMQRYRKMKEDATPVISRDDVPIIDQVAAAEVSQVENMNPDVPIPDEVIERVASIHGASRSIAPIAASSHHCTASSSAERNASRNSKARPTNVRRAVFA
ncbi:MAG: hypothetical protein UDD49_02610 [Collinsella sp.]|nr:hypothetical protein [Collinsella sp.]